MVRFINLLVVCSVPCCSTFVDQHFASFQQLTIMLQLVEHCVRGREIHTTLVSFQELLQIPPLFHSKKFFKLSYILCTNMSLPPLTSYYIIFLLNERDLHRLPVNAGYPSGAFSCSPCFMTSRTNALRKIPSTLISYQGFAQSLKREPINMYELHN